MSSWKQQKCKNKVQLYRVNESCQPSCHGISTHNIPKIVNNVLKEIMSKNNNFITNNIKTSITCDDICGKTLIKTIEKILLEQIFVSGTTINQQFIDNIVNQIMTDPEFKGKIKKTFMYLLTDKKYTTTILPPLEFIVPTVEYTGYISNTTDLVYNIIGNKNTLNSEIIYYNCNLDDELKITIHREGVTTTEHKLTHNQTSTTINKIFHLITRDIGILSENIFKINGVTSEMTTPDLEPTNKEYKIDITHKDVINLVSSTIPYPLTFHIDDNNTLPDATFTFSATGIHQTITGIDSFHEINEFNLYFSNIKNVIKYFYNNVKIIDIQFDDISPAPPINIITPLDFNASSYPPNSTIPSFVKKIQIHNLTYGPKPTVTVNLYDVFNNIKSFTSTLENHPVDSISNKPTGHHYFDGKSRYLTHHEYVYRNLDLLTGPGINNLNNSHVDIAQKINTVNPITSVSDYKNELFLHAGYWKSPQRVSDHPQIGGIPGDTVNSVFSTYSVNPVTIIRNNLSSSLTDLIFTDLKFSLFHLGNFTDISRLKLKLHFKNDLSDTDVIKFTNSRVIKNMLLFITALGADSKINGNWLDANYPSVSPNPIDLAVMPMTQTTDKIQYCGCNSGTYDNSTPLNTLYLNFSSISEISGNFYIIFGVENSSGKYALSGIEIL